MFSNAEAEDRVYDWINGWGTIRCIWQNCDYPIEVDFDNGENEQYTTQGYYCCGDANQTLFWDKPKFEIPQKPFDLKPAYKKLKRVNFIQDKKNFYLTYYGDDIYSGEKIERWSYGLHDDYCSVGTIYYSEYGINDFVEVLNNNNITFEQLEEVIKEVENEKINNNNDVVI